MFLSACVFVSISVYLCVLVYICAIYVCVCLSVHMTLYCVHGMGVCAYVYMCGMSVLFVCVYMCVMCVYVCLLWYFSMCGIDAYFYMV